MPVYHFTSRQQPACVKDRALLTPISRPNKVWLAGREKMCYDADVLRTMPSKAIELASFDMYKKTLGRLRPGGSSTHPGGLATGCAGALAGTAPCTACSLIQFTFLMVCLQSLLWQSYRTIGERSDSLRAALLTAMRGGMAVKEAVLTKRGLSVQL